MHAISRQPVFNPQVNGIYHTLWFTSKYLIFLNAAVNPFIYGVTNEKFKRAFKATKLYIWLFPPRESRSVSTKPNDNQKSSQETSSKLFLIFRKKHRVHEAPTKVIANTKL
ncbi:hypothetical protein NQ317_006948 [Molorchus minor]|uniref:Thyroliberin receptor n=1 Tax=Molorchus minor TaxID=1323400 RepID=A0ABQ9JN35_9CUCU|nr:hypothetical protein NQ317_006948 [Molorchus minor]